MADILYLFSFACNYKHVKNVTKYITLYLAGCSAWEFTFAREEEI